MPFSPLEVREMKRKLGVSTAATRAAGSFSASGHTHEQADVTDLVDDLAGKAAAAHTHEQEDVTGLEAALGTFIVDAPSDGKYYVRKDGAWVEIVP